MGKGPWLDLGGDFRCVRGTGWALGIGVGMGKGHWLGIGWAMGLGDGQGTLVVPRSKGCFEDW